MAKQVLKFTAAWVPGDQEESDPNCHVVGIIQVEDGTPTSEPAHVVLRDYGEDDKPSWWPGVTVPAKKAISYGPAFEEEEFNRTDLHQVKIVVDSRFTIIATDGTKTFYIITNVEDLTA